MITDLRPGDYIKFRYKGGWDYGQVTETAMSFILMSDLQVPIGVTVHQGVWKGPNRTRFEVRRTYIKGGGA